MGLPSSVCNPLSVEISSFTPKNSYDTARKIKDQQDAYCSRVLSDHWEDLGKFPEELQWEALVDVLRGRVKVGNILVLLKMVNVLSKVHNHCYEAVDLDGMVRVCHPMPFHERTIFADLPSVDE